VQPPPEKETDEEKRLRAQQEEEATRDAAEAATAHLPRQGEEPRRPQSATDAFPDEKTIKLNFPHPVTLTLPGYQTVHFPAGVQDVPVNLLDEQYLKDNGVTKV